MSYYLAPSLKRLGEEVTAAWKPSWPTVSIGDGWVGDTSHQARPSDHNPDWSAGGVIRAVDIGIEGRDAQRILDAAIGDPRVWYVIHKGVIYSRTYGWAKRTYTGSSPHDHHIHISINHTRDAETDTSPWLSRAPKPAPTTQPTTTQEDDDMSWLDEPMNANPKGGNRVLANLTWAEGLKYLILKEVQGEKYAQAYLERAQESKAGGE